MLQPIGSAQAGNSPACPQTNPPTQENPHLEDLFLGFPLRPTGGLPGPSPVPVPYGIEIGALNVPLNVNAFPTASVTTLGTLAINLQRSVYKDTDDFVQRSPLRKAVTADLKRQHPDKEIRWVERYMMIKAGAGGIVGIPIVNMLSGAVGTFLSGFVYGCYIRPIVVGVDDETQTGPGTESLVVPYNAEKIQQMPVGAQFEITGLGSLSGFCGVYFGPGEAVGPYTAGAFIGFSASMLRSKGFTVAISRLPDHNKARVQVKEFQASSVGFNLFAMVGLVLGANPLNIPAPGIGFIQHYTSLQGYATMGAMATQYTSLNMFAGRSTNSDSCAVGMYDYDLTDKDACKAMEEAIFNRDSKSKELASLGTGVVTQVQLEQNSKFVEHRGGILFCGEKAIMGASAKSKEEGKLVYVDGSRMVYQDSAYKRTRESVFAGKKEITWEHFLKVFSNQTEGEHTYRLKLKSSDHCVSREEALYFQRIVDALDVPYQANIDPAYPKLKPFERLIRGGRPVSTSVDMFFSQTGTEKIANCSYEDAVMAYLKAISLLDSRYQKLFQFIQPGTPLAHKTRAMLKEASSSLDACCIPALGKGLIPNSLSKSYETLTNGRSLKDDSLVWLLAMRFADAIATISDPSDSKQICDFFTQLGESRGFDYAEVMVALRLIVGKKCSKIHELKMEGDLLLITAQDEGFVTTPQQEIDKAMEAA